MLTIEQQTYDLPGGYTKLDISLWGNLVPQQKPSTSTAEVNDCSL